MVTDDRLGARRAWRTAIAVVAVISLLGALSPIARAVKTSWLIKRITANGGLVVSYAPVPFADYVPWRMELRLRDIYPVRDNYDIVFGNMRPWGCGGGQTLAEGPERDRAPGEAGLAAVVALGRVRRLYLYDPSVSDTNLAAVGRLDALEELDLMNTGVTGPGLAHLRNPRLAGLDLRNTAIDDAGLSHLDNLPSLAGLDLRDTKVTAAGLSGLTRFPALRGLSLSGARIDDESVRALVGLHLEQLDLSKTAVTDAAIEHLAGLPLENLDLSDTAVTDAAIEHLERLPHLKWIWLCHTRVTDAAVARSRSAVVREWPNVRTKFVRCPRG